MPQQQHKSIYLIKKNFKNKLIFETKVVSMQSPEALKYTS